MWLFFALITPLFFAIVHVLDSHCVEDIFDRPWMGFVTSAIASLVVLMGIHIALPLLNSSVFDASDAIVVWGSSSPVMIGAALLAGCLIQLSQLLYFNALKHTEAGIVAAYWNLVPVFVLLLSFLLFRESLGFTMYIGVGVLIGASIAFCALDTNLVMRRRSLLLMTGASMLQAVMFLLQDIVFASMPYTMGFTLITLGLVITGVTPLLFASCRSVFTANLPRLQPAIGMLLGIEIVNLLALASSQKAVDLGIPSLVSAVETTIPAYTFAVGIVLLAIAPRFGDPEAKHFFSRKIGLVGLMSAGVYLLT